MYLPSVSSRRHSPVCLCVSLNRATGPRSVKCHWFKVVELHTKGKFHLWRGGRKGGEGEGRREERGERRENRGGRREERGRREKEENEEQLSAFEVQ